MSTPSALRWRSVRPDAIAFREWDGEFVVRNEQSGSTHMLGALGGQVLQILLRADAALSSADIAIALDSEDRPGYAPDKRAAVDEILQEFQRLGLAQPESP